jgi:hypothetical protein
MNTAKYDTDQLLDLFTSKKVLTLPEMKKALGTNSTMTIFRKLKQLNYISSCSHRSQYYTLKKIAKFNKDGLWFFNSILFSSFSTQSETIVNLIDKSKQGYFAKEIEKILHHKPGETLLVLINKKGIFRKKMSGKYVYFSINKTKNKQQELIRRDTGDAKKLNQVTSDTLMEGLKVAIIHFFGILNEKQKRLYAGLESIKIGQNGDKIIAGLLGLNIKTVAKGRHELLSGNSLTNAIRAKGGGRKAIEKKLT